MHQLIYFSLQMIIFYILFLDDERLSGIFTWENLRRKGPGLGAASLIMSIILFSPTMPSAEAAELNVSPQYYIKGDDVKIFYTLGPKEPNEIDIREIGNQDSPNRRIKEISVKRNESGSVTLPAKRYTWGGYSDFRVTLADAEDFFRVRAEAVPALPGGIELINGPQYSYGDPIMVQVNIPPERVFYKDSTNPRYELVAERLPQPILGDSYGTIARRHSSERITEAAARIDWSSHSSRGVKFNSGFYRLRLMEGNQTVDSIDFMVLLKSVTGGVSITNKDQLKCGREGGNPGSLRQAESLCERLPHRGVPHRSRRAVDFSLRKPDQLRATGPKPIAGDLSAENSKYPATMCCACSSEKEGPTASSNRFPSPCRPENRWTKARCSCPSGRTRSSGRATR